AITMNMALDGESPYDNADLFRYLQRHMAVLSSEIDLTKRFYLFYPGDKNPWRNSVFYTTDGMRFEFGYGWGVNGVWSKRLPLHEHPDMNICLGSLVGGRNDALSCGGCGSMGLNNNPDNTTKVPCLITVDVNGDRKPNPENVNCKSLDCAKEQKYSDPQGKKLTDYFSIMITDREAIPYGIAAQRAMYNSQK
ncbi:MAG: hypothetical protein Q4F80_04910, partial [bacterium]|nr:hypothetical protein [bacterium]